MDKLNHFPNPLIKVFLNVFYVHESQLKKKTLDLKSFIGNFQRKYSEYYFLKLWQTKPMFSGMSLAKYHGWPIIPLWSIFPCLIRDNIWDLLKEGLTDLPPSFRWLPCPRDARNLVVRFKPDFSLHVETVFIHFFDITFNIDLTQVSLFTFFSVHLTKFPQVLS